VVILVGAFLYLLPDGISRFQAYIQQEKVVKVVEIEDEIEKEASASAKATADREEPEEEAIITDMKPVPSPAPIQEVTEDAFPIIKKTIHPVSQIPNWGAMKTPEEWNRSYSEMNRSDFVRVPDYTLALHASPMDELTDKNVPEITAKLYYSTRFFGAYDLDAGEYSGAHPGIDLKLALGTPISGIADGVVHTVASNPIDGLYIAIEHRSEGGERFMSVYKHLDIGTVKEGDKISAGQIIGNAGMTGNTSAPHLHLQVDVISSDSILEHPYKPYLPEYIPTAEEANRNTMNPLIFIEKY